MDLIKTLYAYMKLLNNEKGKSAYFKIQMVARYSYDFSAFSEISTSTKL